jgi:predicted enzyme related to lactoylglutathione lyase
MAMIKKTFLILALAASFGFGFAFNPALTRTTKKQINMKKVTGIGGVFFKCKDPKAVNEWYKKHLGFETTQYGTSFEWRLMDDSSKKGLTQWNPFSETTKYFDPSTKDFMINYRVENLEALVEELKKEGVTVLDKIETYDYGKFIHILDLEGNKIELWEPMGE